MRVSLLLFTAVTSCSMGAVLAQNADPTFPPDFPPRSIRLSPFTSFTTSDNAEKAFKERAALVIKWNACGRELEYETLRDQLKKGNFTFQGNLLPILSAKIAWLNDPQLGLQACEAPGPIYIPTSHDPSAGATAANIDVAVFKDTIKFWHDPASPKCQQLLSEDKDQTDSPDRPIQFPLLPPFPAGGAGLLSLSILVKVTPDCMRAQVNNSIRAMQRHSQMGTDGSLCIISPKTVKLIPPDNQKFADLLKRAYPGDWDANVRGLTRLLYMGRIVGPTGKAVLDPGTVNYMYTHLLAAKGKLGDANYSALAGCDDPAGDDLSSPEDWADQEKWYNELLSGLGDLARWLTEFWVVEVTAGALYAGVGLDVAPLLLITADNPQFIDVRIPETENHRLMIESSRYLTNNAMIRELQDAGHDKGSVDAKIDEQKTVREWLLGKLHAITINDFDEYNSRPYTDYSLESILNLYDFSNLSGFSDDQEMCTASAIVLDLSAAKFIAGSNRGRRIVPYRRLNNSDGTDPEQPKTRDLYDIFSGSDHEVVRAILLAGQTQLLNKPKDFKPPDPNKPTDPHHDQIGVSADESGALVNTAISDYRLPDELLKIVADRDNRDIGISQSVRHVGIESYYSSRAYTMSLGGIHTPGTLFVLGVDRPDDRGIAVPTSIIPTIVGKTIDDVFSFQGAGTQDKRSENLCGFQGFICGINPDNHLPDLYGPCTAKDTSPDDSGTIVDYRFVNSATCFPTVSGPHFYLAAKFAACPGTFCKKGLFYGLMEITEIAEGFEFIRDLHAGPQDCFI